MSNINRAEIKTAISLTDPLPGPALSSHFLVFKSDAADYLFKSFAVRMGKQSFLFPLLTFILTLNVRGFRLRIL